MLADSRFAVLQYNPADLTERCQWILAEVWGGDEQANGDLAVSIAERLVTGPA